MAKVASLMSRPVGTAETPNFEIILNALVSTIMVITNDDIINYLNNAGEQLFQGSASHLTGQNLNCLIPADSPIFAVLKQVKNSGTAVSEYSLHLETPRISGHLVDIYASPLPDRPDFVILAIKERSIAATIDRQLTHRGSARSVSALAAMLAHEVKNPLSGIRGAAQLLEDNASDEDKELARLIRDETDRIVSLINRMDIFSDGMPFDHKAINIHQVLNRVRKLGESSFAKHVNFVENYDPSLPFVLGNNDQLVQVFLNLIKNAAEATSSSGGEIILTTAYKHGVRFALPGSNSRVHLPLKISIQDNGEGISEDIRGYMFDAFVTNKPEGSGLGLALVAKIIDDHGGIIELESHPSRTIFHVMLPMDTSASKKIKNNE
jgi:two-component system, NtrC family, nitrogen regulation sensor histidine kinase GlnL